VKLRHCLFHQQLLLLVLLGCCQTVKQLLAKGRGVTTAAAGHGCGHLVQCWSALVM
jgi:hypothetical protein